MSNKIDLLLKIKALVERGIGGEKEGAAATLARLMEKYGVSEDELEGEVRKTAFFSYSQEIERRLLNQIIYMVTGEAGAGCVGTYTGRKRKKIGADVTAAEKLEIQASYDFFKNALKTELNIFMAAFMNKNGIFPPPEKDKSEKSGQMDFARDMKVAAMMNGMDRHTLRKRIEGGAAE